jgi:hypothetical protein
MVRAQTIVEVRCSSGADFLRYCTSCDDSNYDWGDMSLPFLNLHNEDAFEPVERCMPKYELNHRVALTLLKIRLLTDLRTIQDTASIGEKVPQEILDNIREQLVRFYAFPPRNGLPYISDES